MKNVFYQPLLEANYLNVGVLLKQKPRLGWASNTMGTSKNVNGQFGIPHCTISCGGDILPPSPASHLPACSFRLCNKPSVLTKVLL